MPPDKASHAKMAAGSNPGGNAGSNAASPPRPKRIVVTPAGRKRYLEILARHLAAQGDDFDEWWLLVNTREIADIGYCERLAARNEWVQTKYAEGSRPEEGNLNIHRFLNEFCREPGTQYLRLDDDLCYLAPGFVKTMFDFRTANPEYFLVYGNIVNNAACGWVHHKLGAFSSPKNPTYACMCEVGWKDPEFAESVHRAFLEDPAAPRWRGFERWVLTDAERVSVNAICWTGEALADGVAPDEELWLSVEHPRARGLRNAVCGAALCVHFAFHTQRHHLDSTDLLHKYSALAPA